jgi:hypothetical protein
LKSLTSKKPDKPTGGCAADEGSRNTVQYFRGTSDSTHFDEDKAQYLVAGKTARTEVIQISGRPAG